MLTADPGRIHDINFARTDLGEICHRAVSTTDLSELCCKSYDLPNSLIPPPDPFLNMTHSPYTTHLQAAASTPPPPPRHRRIIVRLSPCEDSTPAVEPPVSPVPARVADPLAFPVALPSPLEPLFLGMGDNTVIPSPLVSPPPAREETQLVGEDYSPASPLPNLYEVDAQHPPLDLMTPERQAAWEAELARSPTPPPMANKVIDAVLDAPRPGTPVYQLEVQPLTLSGVSRLKPRSVCRDTR
ncbi:uncharacterized protein UDID_18065 [Ustilago sp. UG-2017a]|nr:uncharacterized protein UDID_18065 [Ustilago sp. UG-2017a]